MYINIYIRRCALVVKRTIIVVMAANLNSSDYNYQCQWNMLRAGFGNLFNGIVYVG